MTSNPSPETHCWAGRNDFKSLPRALSTQNMCPKLLSASPVVSESEEDSIFIAGPDFSGFWAAIVVTK